MTENCAYRITSYEPVVEVLIRAEQHYEGWSLWLRHRHFGGLFADCPPDEFDSLSHAEMLDVLCAHAALWGPAVPSARARLE